MKKLHLALASHDIETTVADYSKRFETEPTLVIPGEYALWRTETLNVSIRRDLNCRPGELRHLGWEDPDATAFTAYKGINHQRLGHPLRHAPPDYFAREQIQDNGQIKPALFCPGNFTGVRDSIKQPA